MQILFDVRREKNGKKNTQSSINQNNQTALPIREQNRGGEALPLATPKKLALRAPLDIWDFTPLLPILAMKSKPSAEQLKFGARKCSLLYLSQFFPKRTPVNLLVEGCVDVGMAVAHRYRHNPSKHVQVFPALVVVQILHLALQTA